MQIYYMKKEKIPISVSTVILLVVTIAYKFVLVVIGVGVFLFGRDLIDGYLQEVMPVYYLGLVLNVICIAGMATLVFYPQIIRYLLTKGFGILEKSGFIKKKGLRERIEASIDRYHDVAGYLKSHKKIMANVLIITFFQRIALFAVTWFVYKALGLSGVSFWNITLLQGVISVAVDMLPLPGGMGISENLFLKIFLPIFGMILLPGMVLSRGLGYYAQLLISAVFTGVAQLRIGKRKEIRA